MNPTLHVPLDDLRSLLYQQSQEGQSDGQLLQRYTETRDSDAFAVLLRRHGSLVLNVARRVVGDHQTAEDVFQATFLTLARRAVTIRRAESLSCWLHGVAFRLAVRARRTVLRSRQRETLARPALPPTPLDELTAREFLAVFDEELQALPEAYRGPVFLCCLEGLSQEEAARQLGCSPGSLKGRLERGRNRLRTRLVQRGLTLPAVLAGPALLAGSVLAAPSALVQSTLQAAVRGSGGSPAALALLPGAFPLLGVGKLRLVCALVLLVVLAGGGVGMLAQRPGVPKENEPPVTLAANQAGQEPAPPAKRVDLHGDPLPDGAVMRLGTLQRRAVGAHLALTPDGKSIIGFRGGKYVHVWNADTGKLRETRALDTQPWDHAYLSADGRWLVTDGFEQGSMLLWDVATSKQVRKLTIKGAGSLMPVAFSPDGKKVAATGNAGDRHYLRVWELDSGKEVFAQEVRVNAGSDQLVFTPNSKRLLASFMSIYEGMSCWDLATGQRVWQNKEFTPSSMAFTPDGKVLSTIARSPLVDLATGKPVPAAKLPPLKWENRLGLTPDGRLLFVSTAGGVIVWDWVAGKDLRTLSGAGEEFLIAPDGKTLVTNNGSLQRWDLATGKPLWTDNFEQGHVGEVVAVAFSADGKRLTSGSTDGTVRLWDVSTGKPLFVWRGHEAWRPVRVWRWARAGVTALDMSPDGRWVISAGSEERIQLWDASTGKNVTSITLPGRERGEDRAPGLSAAHQPRRGPGRGVVRRGRIQLRRRRQSPGTYPQSCHLGPEDGQAEGCASGGQQRLAGPLAGRTDFPVRWGFH